MSDEEPQTRAISSIIITTPNASAPCPPYCVGTWAADKPARVSAFAASCGKR